MGRRIASLIWCLALAACASAPQPQPRLASAPAEAARSAAPSAVETLLQRAGRADAPSVEAVERALGAADLRREDGAGTLLTYRRPGCALLLVFSEGRLAEANAGPERLGAARPTLGQCAAALSAR